MIPKFTVMEKIVGVFILLTFMTFIATLFLVGRGQHWFQKRVSYYAVYKEGYNIQPGVKVRFLRTDVGHVTNVELTEDNKAKVTFSILAQYASRIRVDSQAAIESPTLIGSEYINIVPGKKTKVIKPGGEIPSKEAKKIAEYLEDFDFEHKMLLLDEILENVARVLDQLQQPDRYLFGTLDNLDNLTESISEGDGTIGRLVNQDEMYNRIMDEIESLNRILGTLERTAKDTTAISSGVKTRVPPMMDRVGEVLKRLQEISILLHKAMEDVPEISERAREGMRDVNDILESVKRNILIRGNLPQKTKPKTHGLEFRGD